MAYWILAEMERHSCRFVKHVELFDAKIRHDFDRLKNISLLQSNQVKRSRR